MSGDNLDDENSCYRRGGFHWFKLCKVSSEKLSVSDCISSFYSLLNKEEKEIYHEIF